MTITKSYFLDDLDFKNLEKEEGNNGDFTAEAKASGNWASLHFDNINDYKLFRYFNNLDVGSEFSSGGDEENLYHQLIS